MAVIKIKPKPHVIYLDVSNGYIIYMEWENKLLYGIYSVPGTELIDTNN